MRVFCEEYTAELPRLRAGAGAARAAKEAELVKVRLDHGKLVDAILASIPPEQVKDRMMELDARRQQLEAELSAAPEPHPVRLHPGMADTYRGRVQALVAALADSDPVQALEAREAVRALVDRIVLTSSEEDPLVPVVDLEGALAGLLALATGAGPTGTARVQKPASLGEAGLQSVLVAGA